MPKIPHISRNDSLNRKYNLRMETTKHVTADLIVLIEIKKEFGDLQYPKNPISEPKSRHNLQDTQLLFFEITQMSSASISTLSVCQ